MKVGLFNVMYVAGFVIGSVIRKVYTCGYRRGETRTRHRSVVDAALVALTAAGLFVLPLVYLFTGWLDVADFPLPAWMGWGGTAVFAAALWLLWRSHADLGPNWSAELRIRCEHTLVTGGVYRRIRHPMYAAHWLWGIAQALLLGNWIAGPSLLVTFLPLYLLRVGREERMMREAFGEEYRRYMRRTGRVIPRCRP